MGDWRDGDCDVCQRTTRVIPVNKHGGLCIVCVDYLAEHGAEQAQEVIQ